MNNTLLSRRDVQLSTRLLESVDNEARRRSGCRCCCCCFLCINALCVFRLYFSSLNAERETRRRSIECERYCTPSTLVERELLLLLLLYTELLRLQMLLGLEPMRSGYFDDYCMEVIVRLRDASCAAPPLSRPPCFFLSCARDFSNRFVISDCCGYCCFLRKIIGHSPLDGVVNIFFVKYIFQRCERESSGEVINN